MLTMTDQKSPLALVTGGASGIGEAAARTFVARGWRVIIGDVNDQRAEAVAAELRAAGGTVSSLHLDVTDEAAVATTVEAVWREHGPVDALVNSGGILQNAVRITDMAIAEFDRIIDVNLRGTLLMCQAVGSRMAGRGAGSIINLCSLTSYQALPQPAYAMSKVGVKMLTEVLAAELGPKGVRVNAVAPGYTLTPAMKDRIEKGERDPAKIFEKTALRKFVEPSDVGHAIHFLCSPEAGAITGVTLPIDCGWLVYSVYSSSAAQPKPE